MLISQDWITRLLNNAGNSFDVDAQTLDTGFVRVGFETEGFAAIPESTGPLVIGRVEQIEELTGFKKPIRFCQVNVGDANGTGELQGIICGARNFQEGSIVVVSLPGAVLPGGFEIAARKTYDHISNGMICSAAELGFSDKQTKGIITLDESFAEKVGQDARELIGVDDTVFDVNVTPDRGYALSARGLTREIASSFDLRFKDPAVDPSVAGIDLSSVPAAQGSPIGVELQPETKAQRFGLRKVTGIDPSVDTPFWMQRELMLCGVRPVNTATDVTNYVMMLLGQPMHAFDASIISGDLQVRTAQAGEEFETLDHVKRELHEQDVVICDDNGIQSLAGIMGGTHSEISESTTDVFFEAATWDPITIARTSRRHKLSSEASRRFERGVDPALIEVSLDVACALLISIAGGCVEEGRTLVGEVNLADPISLRTDHPSELIGVDYSRETVINRLKETGCTVAEQGDELAVTPATWRTDITMDVDLIEEIVRLEGLDDIPLVLPTPRGGRGLTASQKRTRAIGHALAHTGYAEILPTPFIANDTFDKWGVDADDDRRQTVKVQNPLDSDYAILATTLLPSMLEAVSRNVARGHNDLQIFGVQQVALKRADGSSMPPVAARPSDNELNELLSSLPYQPLHAATVGVGEIDSTGPWGQGRAYTYADAIESAQIVARAANVKLELRNSDHLPWHPGRCAELSVDGQVVGYAGELHPQVLEDLGLPERTCAMELDITALPLNEELPAPVLSAFPVLNQDIALVVDESVPAEDVRRVLEEGAGDLLEAVELFDVFRGAQVGDDKKSLAFKLSFRAVDRTLTDEEANAHRIAAADLAKERLGAQMRA